MVYLLVVGICSGLAAGLQIQIKENLKIEKNQFSKIEYKRFQDKILLITYNTDSCKQSDSKKYKRNIGYEMGQVVLMAKITSSKSSLGINDLLLILAL